MQLSCIILIPGVTTGGLKPKASRPWYFYTKAMVGLLCFPILPMNSSALILQNLKSNGERITAVRRALVDILTSYRHPISVQDVLTKLKNKKLSANKTTVYRQLTVLEQYNIVREIRFSDRMVRYELASADDHHHHLVCLRCSRVEDVAFNEDVERQEKKILKKYKFKVTRHSLEFFGLCGRCQ